MKLGVRTDASVRFGFDITWVSCCVWISTGLFPVAKAGFQPNTGSVQGLWSYHKSLDSLPLMIMKQTILILAFLFAVTGMSVATPSRPIHLDDTLALVQRLSVEDMEVAGITNPVSFDYDEENNRWMVITAAPIQMRLQAGDLTEAVEGSFNIFELDPSTLSVVDAHLALPAEEGVNLDPVALMRDPLGSGFLVLDRASGSLLRYVYLPDEEKILIENATRWVEILVEQEPVEVEEEYEIEVDAPTGIQDAESGDEQKDDADGAIEGETDESPDEALTVAAEAAENGAVANAEDSPVQAQEEVEETLVEGTQAASMEPEAAPAEKPRKLIRKAVRRTWVTPEPKIERVEETYPVEKKIIVKRKFGSPSHRYPLDSMGITSVMTLGYDPVSGDLGVLGNGEDESLVWLGLQWTDAGLESSGNRVVFGTSERDAKGLGVDPVSGHWFVAFSGKSDLLEFTRDGRYLRKIAVPGFSDMGDLRFLANRNASGIVESCNLWVIGKQGIAAMEWSRGSDKRILWVPGSYPTIQSAIDASASDSWIVVSPGIYREPVKVSGKSVQLVSCMHLNGDAYFAESTIIESPEGNGVTVDFKSESNLYLAGMRIQNSKVGIASASTITVESCEILDNDLGVRMSGGTAMIQKTLIARNKTDGVRYADATASMIEYSRIIENGGNGIVVIITPYDKVLYRTVIRRNEIMNNGLSGILFEDQPIATNREFRIENNFLIKNARAGIEVHVEQQDPLNPVALGPRTKDPVFVINNTLSENDFGVLGGGNLKLINNIVSASTTAGIKDLKMHSIVDRNLFWKNKENSIESNFDLNANMEADPMFVGEDYTLSMRSPARGKGRTGNLWRDDSDRAGANLGASR